MVEEKSKLEKVVEQGIYGEPELKKEEKSRYLDQYRERVIKALTKEQVEEPGVYPQVLQALKDPRASKLVLRRDVDLERARDYVDLARKQKVAFKRIDSPKLKGEIALVVVGADAVDEEEIFVSDRKIRLKELGFSQDLIHGVGGKLCGKCWSKLATICPEELINYQRITWIESLLGTKCIRCGKSKK